MMNKVLITNDDGIKSYGLHLLKNILQKFAVEVYVVSPKDNMSGASRSISLKKDINYSKISPYTWTVDGTPTDCIIFAMNYLFKEIKPDYIFSGINAGTNIGDEISYSGTVGAAFEGAIRGVPSLAISQKVLKNDIKEYAIIKKKLSIILPEVLGYFTDKNLLLNLNFPLCNLMNVKELKVVKCANQKVSDEIYINEEKSSFKIGKMNIIKTNSQDDLSALDNGFITLTSITTNLSKVNFYD